MRADFKKVIEIPFNSTNKYQVSGSVTGHRRLFGSCLQNFPWPVSCVCINMKNADLDIFLKII